MTLLTKLAAVSAFVLAAVTTVNAAPETYVIDNVHSSVGFSIRHNVVAKVQGSFAKFTGSVTVDPENLAASTAEATIDAASITTLNEKRDTDLRSANFFDVANFPKLTFKSKSWTKTGTDTFNVTGDLTIHGVTKEVVLNVTSLGVGAGMKPGTKVAGWEATTKVNRRDFGVNGPAMLGKMVGDDVTITISVEADTKS
jgi:polyisoprenoid-binding protein YceI